MATKSIDIDTIQHIKNSWALINNNSESLISVYEKMFRLAPESRGMFGTEMIVQVKKLEESLKFIVDNIEDLKRLRILSKELKRSHASYNLEDKHFEILNEAFVEAIREILGEEYRPEIGESWMKALSTVSEYMK